MRGGVLTVFACAVLAVVAPAPATAYLYWTGVSEVPGVVDRAALNGSDLTTPFIVEPLHQGPVLGVAVGESGIYFSENLGWIGRASLQGDDVQPDLFRIPQPVPEGPDEPVELDASSLAIGGGYLYWCTNIEFPHRGDYYDIGRARLDGSDIEPEFIKLASRVGPVRVYDGYIYWYTAGAISRARLNGSDVESDVLTLESAEFDGFTVEDRHIYWTSGHSVGRADLDGHAADPRFINGLGDPGAVAVAAGAVYWLEAAAEVSSRPHPRWIGRATIAGGNVRRHFITFVSSIPAPYREGDLVANASGLTGHRHRVGGGVKHAKNGSSGRGAVGGRRRKA